MRRCLCILLAALLPVLATVSCSPQETPTRVMNSSLSQRSMSPYTVTAMTMDAKDLLWIGTDKILATFDGKSHRYFTVDTTITSLPSGNILSLCCDRHGTVWVGTDWGLSNYARLSVFNNHLFEGRPLGPVEQIFETSSGKLVVKAGSDYYGFNDRMMLEMISSLHQESASSTAIPDDGGGLWVVSPSSARHYDNRFRQDRLVELPGQPEEKALCVRQDDRIWTVVSGTLICLGMEDGRILKEVTGFEGDKVSMLFIDKEDLIVRSERKGLVSMDTESLQFDGKGLVSLPRTPSMNDITILYHDTIGNIWAGYKRYGVMCMTPEQKTIESLNEISLHKNTRGRYIVSLTNSFSGRIWGNTEDHVFTYNPYSGEQLEFERDDVMKVLAEEEKTWIIGEERLEHARLEGNSLRTMDSFDLGFTPVDGILSEGKCFLSSDSGYIYVYDDEGIDGTVPVASESVSENACLLNLRDGNILFIGKIGDIRLIDGSSLSQSRLQPTIEGELLENEYPLTAACFGEDVYIASNRSGLFHLDLGKNKLEKVHDLDGIYLNSISCSEGVLIMGSESGVIRYAPETRDLQLFNPSLDQRGIKVFTPGGSAIMEDKVVFGSDNGCIVIPSRMDVSMKDHRATVHLVLIKNRKGNRAALLPEDESLCVFNYRDNSFDILYGTVNYGNQPLRLRYMLEGYTNDWTVSPERASFVKVPAGSYTFRLQEVHTLKDDVISECQMKVVVKKAPWNTIGAWILYLLLLGTAIYFIIRTAIRTKSNRMKLEMAENKSRLEQRTNQMNMSFFANIAHEFRNPLTVISGPLSSLMKDPSLSESAHKKVKAVSGSANTMLRLIDQMLDFNQLEMDVLKLCVGDHDVAYELSRMKDIFNESAELRGISLDTEGLDSPLVATVDIDKLEKIAYNLYTNALKHTPDDGRITLFLDEVASDEARKEFPEADLSYRRYFIVEMTNNGKKIAEDKIGDVFKRYYQTNEANANHDYGWGRGIGLYFVERLVNVHKGAIKVENVDEGVRFSFVIPTDPAAYEGADRENDKIHRILQIDMPSEEKVRPEAEEVNAGKPVILVVDDDIQIGQFVRTLFEEEFHVVNKYSAEAALADIETICPDIIISDVVMGRMSGYDFCKEIKSNLAFCHIPFILLTAKTDVEDSVSGLECGANAYVTKPFSAEYLQALVKSQLRNVEHIRSSLNANTEISGVSGDLSEQDRNFMESLYGLMDKHLSDADLSVTSICEELKISRSKFNYKLKGLTGTTPGTFFRQYKLNLAAKMLKEGRYNVSEISDMMGFSSISNFSASFKKMFGIAPRDYK